MPVQHKYRPHHLALAITLAVSCADFSLAEEVVGEAIPTLSLPAEYQAQLDQFNNAADTLKGSITSAAEGVERTFGDDNDLVTVSGRGNLSGIIDGGGGKNLLQLDTAKGGAVNSRNFHGLEVKRSSWTLNSEPDFRTGVWVRPKATLTNEGHITGGALAQGTLFNKGLIDGGVFVDEKGTFAGQGTAGSLEVNGKLLINEMHGAPTILGDVSLSKSAELIYEVGADGASRTMLVKGTASLGEATLNIVAPKDYSQATEHKILEAEKVEGTFGKIRNNLAFLTPSIDYQEKTVGLIFTRNEVPIAAVATSESARELAENIEESSGTSQVPTLPESTSPIATLPTPLEPVETSVIDTPSAVVDTIQPVSPASAVAETLAVEAAPGNTVETAMIAAPSPATVGMSATVAASSEAVDKPVVTSTPSTQPESPAVTPRAEAAKNAAVAALLGSDTPTASYALEQLAAGNTANLAKATLSSDGPVSASMLSAMRQLDNGSAHSNAVKEGSGRVWFKALGHGGTLDRDVDALRHSTHGLVLGADWGIADEWRLGVIGGKSETRLDSRGLDGDLDSWHLGAYALRQHGPLSLRLGGAYSKHDAGTKRRVAFNGFSNRLQGGYDANTQQAFAELGYTLSVANTRIEPFASLGYQRYQRDSYTEKGGAAALKVDGQNKDNINSTFGLRLAQFNSLDNGMQLTPRFSAGWKHTYGDITNETRQRLVSGSRDFTVSGASLDRNSVVVDAGVDFGVSARHSLGIGLTGEAGTDSRNHGVTGEWRMSF